ncbi:hypothetical protein JOC48_003525 [Aquibacillus albus]|uniref:Family 2 glycosyl transferase n=2 Tax=Aquibacillus albus TaxID=1168171 RepID=A0ABS2N4A4_9BACI|nr:hypothetical protein [Aquibacillus albus]
MNQAESKELENGAQIKFRTKKDQVEIYKDERWSPFFVKGVNLGASLPGHFPGELSIKKEDYLRWFEMIQEMGANTIRIYTILNPEFYQALVEYNQENVKNPLFFMQGVWSPVNLLHKTNDAWSPEVTKQFEKEISDAIGAVNGEITLPDQPGKASGKYTADASSYLVAWHIGTEWDPEMVENTNNQHSDDPVFQGDFFKSNKDASPFESWLAHLMNHTAKEEEKAGWQHPITFTNWITTDPLEHPDEPLVMEDLVSVDATNIQRINGEAGYFASFHAYPYYPDFLRYTDKYKDVKNDKGQMDTYKGYLRELKNYHREMPVMITEFGVPVSRGNAHIGPLGRDQGGHTEVEQGRHITDMLKHIYREGHAGAVIFTWQDEWFKKTWNTMAFENPDRRPFWYNALSVEMSYGLLGMYPNKHNDLKIDGKLEDWSTIDGSEIRTVSTPLADLKVTKDEGYVYISSRLPGDFNPKENTFYLGVDTLSGGIKNPDFLKGKMLDEGLETVVRLGNDNESEVLVAPSYDFHHRLYVHAPKSNQDNAIHSWKLAVSRKLEYPDAKVELPFEEVVVGHMERASLSNDSMAEWAVQGNVIEIKIPWALLGFSDPSSKQVVSYSPIKKGDIEMPTEKIDGIRFIPWIIDKSSKTVHGLKSESSLIAITDYPLYNWDDWQEVEYDEQVKESYYIVQDAFNDIE